MEFKASDGVQPVKRSGCKWEAGEMLNEMDAGAAGARRRIEKGRDHEDEPNAGSQELIAAKAG